MYKFEICQQKYKFRAYQFESEIFHRETATMPSYVLIPLLILTNMFL